MWSSLRGWRLRIECAIDAHLWSATMCTMCRQVGFLDANASGDAIVLGTVTKKTDNSESNVTLRCVGDSLVVTFGPTEDTENLGGGWTFDARSTNGTRAGSDFTWQTKV